MYMYMHVHDIVTLCIITGIQYRFVSDVGMGLGIGGGGGGVGLKRVWCSHRALPPS